MLLLYSLNLLVIINSILITKIFYPKYNIQDKILINFTIYVAQIILFVLLLGIPGILTLPNLVMLTLCFSLIVVFMVKGKQNYPFFPHPSFVGDILLWISQHKLLAISISLFLGFSLVKIFYNLINPPFLWDNLIYRYTFPVEWIKNGNLTNPPAVFCLPTVDYIAMNGEFFYFWFIAPLKNAFIADIGSYLFYVMGAVACFSIMRKLDVSKEIALLGGVLFSLTPQYFKQLLFNGNDIIVASLYLIALNFVLMLRKDFSLRNVVITAITVGLLWGTKSTAMIWVPLLVPLVVYFIIKNYRDIKFSNLILFGVIFIILILIFGGFTYIRNFIETRNPLYPVSYKLLGIKLKGPIDFLDLRDNRSLLDIDLKEMLFHQSFGLHFVLLAFPAFFLSLPVVLMRSRFRLSFDIIYLLALPLVMIIIYYAKCPIHMSRYLYHIIALGTLIGIYTLDKLKLSAKVIKRLIFVLIIAAVTELTGHAMLLYSLLLSGLVFVVGFMLVKKRNIWLFYKISGIALLFVFLIGLVPLESYYEQTKYKNYTKTFHWEKDLTKAWKWIYEQTLHNSKNIAYAGSAVTLPLYGKDFRNNVYYVSVNDKEAYLTNFSKYCLLFGRVERSYQEWLQLMRQDGCLREKADFNTWLKNLYQKGTDLLFIMCTDDFKIFPIEDKWAKMHPDVFRPILVNKRVHVYEIVRRERDI